MRRRAGKATRKVLAFFRDFVSVPLYGILSARMHDLSYFRDHLDLFEEMARNRGITLDLAGFRALDSERRESITAVERLKAERNKANDEIARSKRAGEDASGILAEMKRVSAEISATDARVTEFDARLRDFMLAVPNLLNSS